MIKRPSYLSFDTVDDRREIVQLLARLKPMNRLAFLRWCCSQAKLYKGHLSPQVSKKTLELAELARWDSSADDMLTQEVYKDVWFLSVQYEFDIDSAATKLVQMVRAQR